MCVCVHECVCPCILAFSTQPWNGLLGTLRGNALNSFPSQVQTRSRGDPGQPRAFSVCPCPNHETGGGGVRGGRLFSNEMLVLCYL